MSPERGQVEKPQTPKSGQMDSGKVCGRIVSDVEMEDTMSTRLLKTEDVRALRESAYVETATPRCVRFTTEFKQLTFEELHKGKTIRQIFEENGLDVQVLGEKRLENFRASVEQQADREEGFVDQRKNNKRQPAKDSEEDLRKKLRQVEHRLRYLEQENDFLKKIREAEESNCRRK